MKNRSHLVGPSFSLGSGRRTAALLLLASATWWASPLRAAGDKDPGVRLLQAQLPAGATILKMDCEALSRAVGRATVAHRTDAPSILKAALTNGLGDDETLRKEDKRACECVARLVRASVKAAPDHASEVLEMATSLYPDCAEALAATLDAAKKDVATAYNSTDPANGTPTEQPVAGISSGINDLGSSSGIGFPGSPGFGSSSPGGGFALPDPGVAPAVTPVVNR